MVTLASLAAFAQVVSSIGVVGSLVFVGVELRQSNRVTRAQSHHAITQELNRINLLWAQSRSVAQLWCVGMQDRAALTPQDRWRFDALARAYLHVCETMYVQASLGAGDSGIVAAEEAGLRSILTSPSVAAWWAENLFGFSQDFRRYVDRLMAPAPRDVAADRGGRLRDGAGSRTG